MDYTANHHMPQWVKSDRIMMDDFNQMCRDIEAGLDKAQATASNVLDTAQNTDLRLRTIAADMSRDFYRQAVQQQLHHKTAGLMDSMWLNTLSCREDAPGLWSGRSGVTLSTRKATMEGIRSSAKEESYVCTIPGASYQNDTAAVTFTSDGYGILESVDIVTEWRSDYTSTDVDFTIFLYEEDTGRLVGQAGPFKTEQRQGRQHRYTRQVNFPLAEGVKYRMSFSVPTGQGYQRTTYFVLAASRSSLGQNASLTLKDQPAAANISRAIAAPSWATGGIGIIRWSGNGSVGLTVNGKALTSARSRQFVDAEGRQCRETELQLTALPGASMTFAATLQRGAGDLSVYDFGMLWK